MIHTQFNKELKKKWNYDYFSPPPNHQCFKLNPELHTCKETVLCSAIFSYPPNEITSIYNWPSKGQRDSTWLEPLPCIWLVQVQSLSPHMVSWTLSVVISEHIVRNKPWKFLVRPKKKLTKKHGSEPHNLEY